MLPFPTHRLIASILLVLALPAQSQTTPFGEGLCATPSLAAEGTQLAPALKFPTVGTVNALIVFVQNRDDTQVDDCFDGTRNPVTDFREFPPSVCAGQPDRPALQSTSDDPVTEWPQRWGTASEDQLPSWAPSMLAAPNTSPANFAPGSLPQLGWAVHTHGVRLPEGLRPHRGTGLVHREQGAVHERRGQALPRGPEARQFKP